MGVVFHVQTWPKKKGVHMHLGVHMQVFSIGLIMQKMCVKPGLQYFLDKFSFSALSNNLYETRI